MEKKSLKTGMRSLFCSFLIQVFAVAVLSAAGAATGGQALEFAPDARTAAMAAFTAIADDVNCLYYNPAGLAVIERTEIPLSNSQLLEGVNYQYTGIACSLRDVRIANVRDLGAFAVTFAYLDSGKIEGRDTAGNETGTFSARDRVVTLGYGKTLFESIAGGRFMIGASAKLISEEIRHQHARNSAFDAGLLWLIPAVNASVGLAVRNFGGALQYDYGRFDLPLNVTVGAACGIPDNSLWLAGDITRYDDDRIHYRLGGEYFLLQAMVLRGGYTMKADEGLGLSAGIGLVLKQVDVLFTYADEINLDYAFLPYGELGDTHRFTVVLKLGAD